MPAACGPIEQDPDSSVPSVQLAISPSGCPRQLPALRALSKRCPSSLGLGNHDRSDWSQILSCGESRSRLRCLTPLWCSMCRWWRWGGGPRPWLAASGPRDRREGDDCENPNQEQKCRRKPHARSLFSGAGVRPHLPAFLIVGEVAVSREPSRTKLLPRVGVLICLVKMSRTKTHF